jgi:hypothetical protein
MQSTFKSALPNLDAFFPSSYEDSRLRFLQDLEPLRLKWSAIRLETRPLKEHPDLSIDWLWAEPRHKNNLVIVSTGEHGIEGYVGYAMLKLFIEEFAPRLDPESTGLLLVHAMNPWGMKNHFRINPNNVDLNRNFILDEKYDKEINPDYDLIADFLNPEKPARELNAERIHFITQIIKNLIHPGKTRLQAASLLGQHRHAQGIYFGGREPQEETLVMMGIYRKAQEEYQNFYQIDLHTGYGPRYQMTVLVSSLDEIPSSEAARKFNYPLVQKIDADEFYAISGDMGDYVYRLRDREFPGKRIFAGGFEFGTFGDSLTALMRSLHITILENQLRHHGAVSQKAGGQVRAEYEELFNPVEPKWRMKALADGRQAFEGILRAYRLI